MVRGLIGPPKFAPALSHQVFNIAIWSSLRHSLLPELAVYLCEHAPHVTLYLRPQMVVSTIVELEQGSLDCALGTFLQLPPGLHVETLFTDEWLCVMRKRNPLTRRRVTLKEYAAADHVLMRTSGTGYGIIDEWLARRGLTRRVAFVVNNFDDALEVAKRTDLVATIPAHLRWKVDRALFDSAIVPFGAEKVRCEMLWHERTDKNAAQTWLRSVLKELVMESYRRDRQACSQEAAAAPPKPAKRAARRRSA